MAKLVFQGTKGEIEESTERHRYHSSLLIVTEKVRILVDYGRLHHYTLEELRPDFILITHAHPDHYVWLEEDIRTEIPVYLTSETYEYGKFRPANAYIIAPFEEMHAAGIRWYAYPVFHSLRCPASGYRFVMEDRITLVYNSDVVDIPDKDRVLSGVDYYIGDGSSIKTNLVRRRENQFFGHARITTQLNWCKKYGISKAIFTHLGKETLEREEEFQSANPDVILAHDDMEIDLK